MKASWDGASGCAQIDVIGPRSGKSVTHEKCLSDDVYPGPRHCPEETVVLICAYRVSQNGIPTVSSKHFWLTGSPLKTLVASHLSDDRHGEHIDELQRHVSALEACPLSSIVCDYVASISSTVAWRKTE